MRRYLVHIGIFSAALTILLVYFLNIHRQWTSNEMMSRAQIARMLALMRYDRDECETQKKSGMELPEDIVGEEWYGKYAAVALNEGWMNLREDGKFHPGDTFTYSDLKYIMEQFHLSEDLLSFSLKYRQGDGMVPRTQWCEVYQLLSAESSRVQREKLAVYGTPSNISALGAWQTLTSRGMYLAEGLAMDIYMDCSLEVYTAGNEILCVVGKADDLCRMENVWIESGEDDEIQVFLDGYERSIKLEGRLSQKLEPNMADLTFTEGRLTGVDYKTSRIKAALTGMEEGAAVLKDYGTVPLSENLVVYQIYPSPKVISKDELAADGTVYEFVLQGNEICGIIYQDYAEETIRVLLHGDGEIYEQPSVTVTCAEPFLVMGNDEIKRYEAGTEVTFKQGEGIFEEGSAAVVKAENERGKIQVLSLDEGRSPSYHGEIRFRKQQAG
ncbi:MAG: hypothetical protein ACLTBP_13530 [Frisingicoccus sp.]